MTTSIQNQNHNLAIWSAVEKTDPAHTKTFNRAGGFSGTAVNQAYQARRATELFGPIGIGWGFDELEHQIVEGAAGDKVWFAKVKLWYQHEGRRGEVIQWGATTFVGRNKNGAFTDEEAAKKSITDAVGKCLSLLGFSADVYLGQFDDQKYVNDRRREEAARKQVGGRRQTVDRDAPAEAPREASENRAQGTGHREQGTGKRPPVFSPPANGQGQAVNGHAPAASPSTVYHLPPADPDPDLAAFRDAIAAAETEGEAQWAERLLRSQRALAGRTISDVESALIASCTEAACQRIKAGQGTGNREQGTETNARAEPRLTAGPAGRAGVNGRKTQNGASGSPNGHAVPPDLAEFASPSTRPPTSNGPVTGEHLSRPRGSGTAHPHGRQGTGHREQGTETNAPAEPRPLSQSPSLSVPCALSPVPSYLPSTPGGLAADVAAFRDFCAQALAVTDVKRGEHVLRSQRLRDRIGLGDAESELIAGWADAACRRIRAARKGASG